MSDLVPVQPQVTIAVPEMFFDEMQNLARLLNDAVADDGMYQAGVRSLETIHQQIVEMAENAAAMIAAIVEERDRAMLEKADAELEAEAARLKYEDLETALDEYYWTDVPAVRALVLRVQEDAQEVMEDEFYDHYNEVTLDNMAMYVAEVTGLPHSQAYTFVEAIVEGDIQHADEMWDKETFKLVLKALAAKYSD